MRSKIAPKNIIPAIIMAFLNMGSDNNIINYQFSFINGYLL